MNKDDVKNDSSSVSNTDDGSYVYVIRVGFRDGKSRYPVMIYENDEDHMKQVEEAQDYFCKIYKDKGIITIHYAGNVYEAGVNDVENLLEWKTFKKKNFIA